MGLARDFMRNETLKKRLEMRRRNAEADAEEAERQNALPGGYRPKTAERKMALAGAAEDKMLVPELEDKAPEPTLEDLPWASAAAFGKAQARGLSYDDFEGHEPTGKAGYRAADVATVANAKAGTG